MILADAHLHLFSKGFPGRYGRPGGSMSNIDHYQALRLAHGIKKGLVIGYEAEDIDPDNNAYLRGLAEVHDWIVSLAYVPVEPFARSESVGKLLDAGHRGVAIYLKSPAEAAALAHWPQHTFDQLNGASALISLNATPEATEQLKDVFPRLGGTTILFSHLGLPGRQVGGSSPRLARDRISALLDAARHAHVAVKISALYAISDPPEAYPHAAADPFVTLLLEAFGPERCLWGSDFIPCLDWVSFGQTIRSVQLEALTASERELVMGGNLLRMVAG